MKGLERELTELQPLLESKAVEAEGLLKQVGLRGNDDEVITFDHVAEICPVVTKKKGIPTEVKSKYKKLPSPQYYIREENVITGCGISPLIA